MSGQRPFFITGANAKIKLNGKTMAFCSDFSYSVQILTQTPKVLGMYEGTSVEPLGYSVSGSFSVIRYVKDAASNIGNEPHGIAENDAGNGAGNWGSQWGGLGNLTGVGNDGRANEAMDPSKLAGGTTFDIQVYQKISTQGRNDQSVEAQLGRAIRSISGAATGNNLEATDVLGVANIRNCRITQADFNLTKRGAATQRFNFVALYVDEDSFVADFSGIGQQF